ncbi:MAG: hypothetical protein H7338_03600, partial [Candidatus Sericytochromatia bacterium]|nr:hypothetical protein [Candidatus Sericytochromatia bacterium]
MSTWSQSLAAFRRGDFRACLDGLLPLLQAGSSQPDRLALVAQAQVGMGDYAAALETVARGLARHPRAVPLWLTAA